MRLFISAFMLVLAVQVQAQGYSQVKWDFTSRKNNKSTELVLKATIEKGWHIYSQNLKGDGPLPTVFTFELPANLKKSGATNEPEPIKFFDENFGMEVLYFEKEVEFVQSLKGKPQAGDSVKGKVTFMICNDEMCYPPVDVPFEIKF